MYYYAKKDRSEFGVTLEQLRVRINQPDMPASTTEIGDWVSYVSKDAPFNLPWHQYAVEVYPVDGVMTWEVLDLPEEERTRIEADILATAPVRVRKERNRLLSECDWTQLADCQLTDQKKIQWAEYRQALRDITQQPGFPMDVEWPTKPE